MVYFRVPGAVAPAVVKWARVLLVVFTVVLAVIVLQPSKDHSANGLIVWLSKALEAFGAPYGPTFYTLEFSANVLMFVPLGVLAPLACGSLRPRVLWLTVTAGFLLSACIEFAQLFIPGRLSDPRDLISNTLGAVLGVLVGLIASRLRRQVPPRM